MKTKKEERSSPRIGTDLDEILDHPDFVQKFYQISIMGLAFASMYLPCLFDTCGVRGRAEVGMRGVRGYLRSSKGT